MNAKPEKHTASIIESHADVLHTLELVSDPTSGQYDWVVFPEVVGDIPQTVAVRRLDDDHLVVMQYDSPSDQVYGFDAQIAVIQVTGPWQNKVLVDRAYWLSGTNVSEDTAEPDFMMSSFTVIKRKDRILHVRRGSFATETYTSTKEKADAIQFEAPALADVLMNQVARDRLWGVMSEAIRPSDDKKAKTSMSGTRGRSANVPIGNLYHAVIQCRDANGVEELAAGLDRVADLALNPTGQKGSDGARLRRMGR